jgi:hypothetical protein
MPTIRDYRVSGLCPSSGILKNMKERDVSEAGTVSIPKSGVEDTYSVEYIRRSQH